jgi:hypothetical protein
LGITLCLAGAVVDVGLSLAAFGRLARATASTRLAADTPPAG